ncbi:hypothetical protein AYL99_05836 [Fonsecaea erecta]|uniref:Glutaredoxin-like protein n=1 Tax=Fonsecaea erecta TaxID=1367422 RepID=A0A178ZM01_9EURO|nr:hypothetical protein AYL99_05836 [Fonsecaea erecta]OAP60834.1 hypothetical protein AYL99_05836 [Fonsecaea erecta]
MRPSRALLLPLRRQSGIQLTLFTRANCGLCDVAKARIGEFMANSKSNSTKDISNNTTTATDKQQQQQLDTRRIIHYAEIDIMDPAQAKWRDVYEFDVPVLHVDRRVSRVKGQHDGVDG